jgi:hypothetical protein
MPQSFENGLQSVLTRLPLAGVSTQTYASSYVGKSCLLLNITTRIALVVISSLVLTGILPKTYASKVVLSLGIVIFTAFLIGSKNRKKSEMLLEFAITSTCIVLSTLSQYKILSSMQLGRGVLCVLAGGIFLGVPLDRGVLIPINSNNIEIEVTKELPPFPTKLLDYLVGVARDGGLSLRSFTNTVMHQKYYKDPEFNTESNALCVLLHGLASRPSVLDDYREALNQIPGITIFQPYVVKRGECSLEEACVDVKEKIKIWREANPGGPVFFIGHSNGSKMSAKLSSELHSETPGPMQVHCVAGPFRGTKFVNRPDWPEIFSRPWGALVKFLYSPAIFEELSWESANGATLVNNMQKEAHHDTYKTFFYGSLVDELVFPWNSLFPYMTGAKYYAVRAGGHQGLLREVQDLILTEITSCIGDSSLARETAETV